MGGANYYFFKEGTKPMWEDPANATGGKWTIPAPKSDKEQLLDDFWLHTVHALQRQAQAMLIFAPANTLCLDDGLCRQ